MQTSTGAGGQVSSEVHAAVTAEFIRHLGNYVSIHRLGRVYSVPVFRIEADPEAVLAPDIAFIRAERIAPGKPSERLLATIPDLVVEILSLDDLYDDVQHATLTWLNANCPMVVTVNPRLRSATVFRTRSDIQVLRENDMIDGGDVVPGWTLPLRELFG